MACILVIDDDPDILSLIKRSLEKVGHTVETATSTSEVTPARLRFADLLIVDVMMPGEDGFAFCERMRSQLDCPILFVTAKSAESDLIHGLAIGGDDYIRKPFSVEELRARVAAHLRREGRSHSHRIKEGDIQLDLMSKQVLHKEVVIAFTRSEYAICAYLIERAGQVFSKTQIHQAVFGYDRISDESAITEHVKNIRAKLKPFEIDAIETVWGVGYRWRKVR